MFYQEYEMSSKKENGVLTKQPIMVPYWTQLINTKFPRRLCKNLKCNDFRLVDENIR